MANTLRRVGRYELEERIGRGATGSVWRAADPVIGRPVAVKRLELGDDLVGEERLEAEERFLREARVVGALRDDGIVRIHDAGRDEESGKPWIAMELLGGPSLEERLAAEGRLGPEEVLDLARRLGRALDRVHEAGVVHRDVKPANVRWGSDGLPRLVDFGAVRVDGSDLTQHGHVLGTPTYMAPELLRGGEIDGRSDLFSLAVLLYEALSGERPFQDETMAGLVAGVLTADPPPLSGPGSTLSPSIDDFFRVALAKNADGRFPSGRVLARELAAALEAGVDGDESDPATRSTVVRPDAAPEGGWPQVPGAAERAARRRIRAFVTFLVAALLVAAFAAAIRPAGLDGLLGPLERRFRPAAKVALRFDSLLPAGELVVSLDGRILARWRLARRSPTEPRLFEWSGRISPGEHRIAASLSAPGRSARASTTVVVAVGQRRFLRVELDPFRDRLTFVEPAEP